MFVPIEASGKGRSVESQTIASQFPVGTNSLILVAALSTYFFDISPVKKNALGKT